VNDTIRALQQAFDLAELHADTKRLEQLIADDFLSIGPKGFILNKAEWIGRHVHFKYHALDTSDMDIRLYEKTAIVRNIQKNKASYQDQHVELTVRVSQVWVYQPDGQWRLTAIQFSPMEEG
jgi:hypothetical protein